MKVRLRTNLTGTRDGKPWPQAGSEMDLSETEAMSLVRSGDPVALGNKDADVELRLGEEAERYAEQTTVTRERQARSKRAHEPLNVATAEDEQPAEDDNGPRKPEINAVETAKVEDPAVPTQSEGGPTGETVKPSEGKAARK